MTHQEKESLRQSLLKALSDTQKTIQELQELCQPISPECALGDLARFELMHDQQSYQTALGSAQTREKRLHYALAHIDQEDFGICSECDEKIAYERLLLLPESRLCVSCASKDL